MNEVADTSQTCVTISRVEFFDDRDGAEIYLTGKPAESALAVLRGEGWRWYPIRKCWWRYHASQHLQLLYDVFSST